MRFLLSTLQTPKCSQEGTARSKWLRLPSLENRHGCFAAIDLLSLTAHPQSEKYLLDDCDIKSVNRQHAQAQGSGPADLKRGIQTFFVPRDPRNVSAREACMEHQPTSRAVVRDLGTSEIANTSISLAASSACALEKALTFNQETDSSPRQSSRSLQRLRGRMTCTSLDNVWTLNESLDVCIKSHLEGSKRHSP